MQKTILILSLLFFGFAPSTYSAVQPLSLVYAEAQQNVPSVSVKKMPKTAGQKWAMAGFIVLLIVGIALTILGIVLFIDLAKNGFDGGHLGIIPSLIVAIILALGLFFSVFSGKKIKKLKTV